MLVNEAKIIRAMHGAPQHMRNEAERVLKMHKVLTSVGFLATDYATMQPADIERANKVLLCNLMLACEDRRWLPTIRVVVTRTVSNEPG